MKKPKLIPIIVSFVLSFCPIHSFSQWQMAEGLDGAEVRSMVSTDSMLFAASFESSIYTKTGTDDWVLSKNYSSRKLEIAGNCVIAYDAVWRNAIRSFDFGVRWESMGNDFNQLCSIDTVIFYRQYRSFDYASTFETFPCIFPYEYLATYSDDSLLYGLNADEWGNHKLYCSNNYGNAWDSIPLNGFPSLMMNKLKSIQYINGTYWAHLRGLNSGYCDIDLILIFNDSLSQWIEISNNLPACEAVTSLCEFNEDVFAAVHHNGVFKFDYSDSTWTQFADASKEVNQLLTHNNHLYCATDQGPCVLDSVGNWSTLYLGMYRRELTSIDTNADKVYVTANNELFYSEDGGCSFVRNENVNASQIIATDSVLYIITDYGFKMSRDSGETWISYSDSLNTLLRHLSISTDYYFIGTQKGLFRSASDSIAWERVENGPFWSDFVVWNVEAINNAVLVSDIFFDSLYFSNNYGSSFSDYGDYCAFTKVDQSFFLLKDSIYYSTDLAQTWKSIPVEANPYYGKCIDTKGDTIITGGGGSNGIVLLEMTTDSGEHWVDIIDDLVVLGFIFEDITQLKIVDGKICIGNPKFGLWYRDDILTGTNDAEISSNSKITTFSVYPNPFSVTLNVELSEDYSYKENDAFIIYNLKGKQIDRIQVNPYQTVYRWKPSGNVKPGIYLVKLYSEKQFVQSKKIVLVR